MSDGLDILDLVPIIVKAAIDSSAPAPPPPDPVLPTVAMPVPLNPADLCTGPPCRNWVWEHGIDPELPGLPRYDLVWRFDINSYGFPAEIGGTTLETDTPTYSCGTSGCTYYYPDAVPAGICEWQLIPYDVDGTLRRDLMSVHRWLSLGAQ